MSHTQCVPLGKLFFDPNSRVVSKVPGGGNRQGALTVLRAKIVEVFLAHPGTKMSATELRQLLAERNCHLNDTELQQEILGLRQYLQRVNIDKGLGLVRGNLHEGYWYDATCMSTGRKRRQTERA